MWWKLVEKVRFLCPGGGGNVKVVVCLLGNKITAGLTSMTDHLHALRFLPADT